MKSIELPIESQNQAVSYDLQLTNNRPNRTIDIPSSLVETFKQALGAQRISFLVVDRDDSSNHCVAFLNSDGNHITLTIEKLDPADPPVLGHVCRLVDYGGGDVEWVCNPH